MKGKWAIAICLVLSMVLIPSALAGASQTFVVSPSPTGDDTANIQAAFGDAVAAGPGSVVEFTAGDFYISAPVVVSNFDGTVRGKGSLQTTIHLKPGVDFPTFLDPALTGLMGQPVNIPFIMAFLYDPSGSHEVHFESLGFNLVGEAVVWPWQGPDVPADFFYPVDVEGVDASTPSDVSTTWRDIRLVGDESPDYLWGRNVSAGIVLLNVGGTHTMTDSYFETIWAEAISAMWLNGATVTMGGPHPRDRVTIRDAWWSLLTVMISQNSMIDVSNVEAHDLGWNVLYTDGLSNCAVHMWDVDTYNASGASLSGNWGEPSTFLYEHNFIRQAPGTTWAGFEIHETNPDVKSTIVIRNNRISGQDSAPWGPIFTDGAQGALITNNTFTGSGPAAMYLGVTGLGDSGLLVKGNNVQGWVVDGGPYEPDWHGAAKIWLGAGTSGITVVGSGNLRTNVLDETDNPDIPGYDGANILVGVNSQGAHIGQAIRDAMQARIAAKKLLMGKMPY